MSTTTTAAERTRNLCVRLGNKFFNEVEVKCEKSDLNKQAVMVILLKQWVNGDVKI